MPYDKASKMWVGDSKSWDYMNNRGDDIPQASALMAQGVSAFRRQILADEVEHGMFRDGSETNSTYKMLQDTPKMAVSSGVKKTANFGGGGGYGGGFGGHGGDTIKQMPEIYSPLWLTSNLNLPRDRATINAWCRSFFALNPYVHNAISLHSTYPISKLSIKCKNKNIEKFFNDMIEEIDLMNICVQIAQEYWLLGEAFVYAEMDQNRGKWSRLLLQNPDFMLVRRSVVADQPDISLRPDENLKRIVNSNNPADIEQRRKLPAHIIESVRRGGSIHIPNFNISHLARKISPYEIRGTGLPVCVFRSLMLFDQLRESKYEQAVSMVNPWTQISVGSNGPDGLHPTHAYIEQVREMIETASHDKNFKIITQPDLKIERIGYNGGILDISADITQIIKEIFVGLQVPSVLMDGGSDTTYANGGVALDMLKQRYMVFRDMLSLWLRNKIFAPVSKLMDFYQYENGEKQLIIPDIEFNYMQLFDTNDYVQTLVGLTTAGSDGSKKASLHSLYRSMGMNWEDEVNKIRKENIQDAIFAHEKAALAAMDLSSLRSLGENDEIMHPATADGAQTGEAPLPGQAGGGAAPLDLGMPPMPSGSGDMGMPAPPPPTGGGSPPPAS
jgi:hypothetical protein